MSFFIEVTDKAVVLFSSHKDNEPYKKFLSDLEGTFFRELETKQGHKYPGWVFDPSKKAEVEAFVDENEDRESVASLPDIELIFDEILRRLEATEKSIEDLYELIERRQK